MNPHTRILDFGVNGEWSSEGHGLGSISCARGGTARQSSDRDRAAIRMHLDSPSPAIDLLSELADS